MKVNERFEIDWVEKSIVGDPVIDLVVQGWLRSHRRAIMPNGVS